MMKKERGKCYSGEYRHLFSLQHKLNIPAALVRSTGRASAAALRFILDAALQSKWNQLEGTHRTTPLLTHLKNMGSTGGLK